MFYFRLDNENHLFIDISPTPFDNTIEGKIRVSFTQKDIFSVAYQDYDGNLFNFKKSHPIRKEIQNALLRSEWDKFEVNGMAIEGLSNEDGEIVLPELVLLPRIIKKPNPYEKFFKELYRIGFPPFTEQDIIKKQNSYEFLHIYYRIEFDIYHIVFNQREDTITTFEKFVKTIGHTE